MEAGHSPMKSMAFEGSGCSGSTSRTTKHGMKKTPWTPSEDQMLLEYIRSHGEGDWSSIQKKSGLNKSGKSCRNRWANYLRPNLKKGAFSAEEEKLIIELHGKFGNKWARIAAELPGRTDNEVKNYWNMRLKKCQRQGLAHHHPQEIYQINLPLNSSPLPTFSSLSSSQPQDPTILCFSNSVILPSPDDPLPNILDNSNSANNLTFARDNNGGVALSLMASNESNMQGAEAEALGSGTNFIDDELSRLLDDSSPLASPLAEWDDLHPRLCFDLAYKY